jgi:hypothetical protein
MFTDFENFSTFAPAAHQEERVNLMLDQVVAWGRALQGVRQPIPA